MVSGSEETKWRNIVITNKQWPSTEQYTRHFFSRPASIENIWRKIERSRQFLKAIQKNDCVTVDEIRQNILLDWQDKSIGITDFLTALQVNTEQLPQHFLNLIEILALPQFLTLGRRVLASKTGQRMENPQANVSNSALKSSAVGWLVESTVRQMVPKIWFCGCCQKRLSKGSKQNSTVWCLVCGWVHFMCSRLENKTDFNGTFLCSKCSRSRVMIEDDVPFAVAYTKIRDACINPEKAMAFCSQIILARATNCSLKHVNRYLNSSETHTKI